MEGGLAAGCQRQGQKHCQHGGFEGQKMNQILHLIWAAQNSLHQGESLWTVRRDISDQTLTNSWPAVPTYLLQSLQYLLLRSGDHWPVIVINIVRSCICGPSSEVISSFLILMAFVPKWRGERLHSFPVSEASTVITSLGQLFGKTWHGVNRVVGLQSDFNLKQLKRGINIAPVTIAEGHHTSWERIQPSPVNSKMR